MATKYRRLTYRDYDSSAMLTALEGSIGSSWRAMQEDRRAARDMTKSEGMRQWHSHMSLTFRAVLLELLYIRREARES